MTYYVNSSRDYEKKVVLLGNDMSVRQGDIALRTRLGFADEVNFAKLESHSCGIPFVHSRGQLNIEELYCHNFTADLFNCAGNLDIDKLFVEYDDASFIYSDEYHVDALGQFFNKSGTTVRNVRIGSIVARIKGKHVQGMALTERNRYTDFDIGWNGVDIEIDYKYAFLANQLDNSRINFANSGVRILEKKETVHNTHKVTIGKEASPLVLGKNALTHKHVKLV